MTERENYLKVLNGEQPDWVPNYWDACEWLIPPITALHMATEEKIDCLGVHWIIDDAGPMADTSYYVMDDISDWRTYVHLPDIDAFDWEKSAEEEAAKHDPNKAIAVMPGLGGGCFFIPLMNMMGFENGLCAMYEDPDEVKALFDHFLDWYKKLLEKCITYYHPDVIIMGDDICSANGPFISMDTFNELIRPYFKECIALVKSHGIKFEMHMCGKGEHFIEEYLSLGMDIWQPAQPLNDLAGLKRKYGNRLIFNGTWHSSAGGGVPGAPESVVRQSVRDCMDQFAPGGGMVFWNGGLVGSSEDAKNKDMWSNDEARTYGRSFYQKGEV